MSDRHVGTVSTGTGWTGMVVSLVDLLRWPVAFVIAIVIFKHPLRLLIDALVSSATH